MKLGLVQVKVSMSQICRRLRGHVIGNINKRCIYDAEDIGYSGDKR